MTRRRRSQRADRVLSATRAVRESNATTTGRATAFVSSTSRSSEPFPADGFYFFLNLRHRQGRKLRSRQLVGRFEKFRRGTRPKPLANHCLDGIRDEQPPLFLASPANSSGNAMVSVVMTVLQHPDRSARPPPPQRRDGVARVPPRRPLLHARLPQRTRRWRSAARPTRSPTAPPAPRGSRPDRLRRLRFVRRTPTPSATPSPTSTAQRPWPARPSPDKLPRPAGGSRCRPSLLTRAERHSYRPKPPIQSADTGVFILVRSESERRREWSELSDHSAAGTRRVAGCPSRARAEWITARNSRRFRER